jgi:hypothetical protein
MFGSPILEVILALVGIYLGLGLVCSAACEMVSTWRGWRSRMLASGLRAVLSEARDHEGRTLVERFFQGPLVHSLSSDQTKANGESAPPCLAPRLFTVTVMELIQPPGWSGEPMTFNDYARVVDCLPDSEFKHALQAVGRSSNYDIERVRGNLDTWFDEVMARVSDQYRRRMWMTSLVVSMLICAGLGVDSLALVGSVWGESVRLAERRATVWLVAADESSGWPAKTERTEAPVAAPSRAPIVKRVVEAPPPGNKPASATLHVPVTLDELHRPPSKPTWSQSLGVPLEFLARISAVTPYLMGLLLSTIAVAISARIDFDLFNRFTNLRLGSSVQRAKRAPKAMGSQKVEASAPDRMPSPITARDKPLPEGELG